MINVSVLLAGLMAALSMSLVAVTRRHAQASGILHRLPSRSAIDRTEVPIALPAFVTRFVRAAGLTVSPGLVALGSAVSLVTAAATGATLAGVPGMLTSVVLVLVIGAMAGGMATTRSDQRLVLALPDALDAMGRSVRSGASLPVAIAEASESVPGTMAHELDPLVRQLALGQPLVTVLAQWSERRPLAEVELTAAALSFAFSSGGSQAQVLDGLSVSLRDRQALRREVQALASQAQLSAVVMALLPVGFLVIMVTTDPEMASFLFQSPVGLACLGLGLTLEVIGGAWMRRIAGRVR